MSNYYVCCWRFPKYRVQFTILRYDGELEYQLMWDERDRLFPVDQPYKVQMVQISEAEGKAFDDMSDEELKRNGPSEEFISNFHQKYLEKPFRYVFDPKQEEMRYQNWKNRVLS